jgi:peptidoglycan-associated lipoprotein
MTLSLVLVVGCGPKPVEPYTVKTGNKPEGSNSEYTMQTGEGAGRISEVNLDPTVEPLSAGSTSTLPGYDDQNSDEYKQKHGRSSPEMQPVYFDFDQSTIRSDQTPKMEINGQYLKDHPSSKVVVQGNCDEQGTNEYNLALGERRAMNGKRYLVELGVEEYRIRTMSFGEEQPLFIGFDELTYSQNRRDDFVLE